MTKVVASPRRVVIELSLAGLVMLLPLPVAPLLVLVILATFSIALRGGSWLDTSPGNGELSPRRVALGLVLGILVSVALHQSLGPGPVSVLLLAGNARALWAGLIVALATSAASEMLFRGYVISSMQSAWGDAGVKLGVLVGAILAVVASSPSSAMSALAGFVLSLGFAFLYLAGRRSLSLPIAVHFVVLAQPVVYEFYTW